MGWAATMRRAAYDPETISMLSSVLERAIAALPREQRTEDGKARLASSILAAAARGERDPIQLYAAALVGGAWEPSIGGAPPRLTTGFPEGQCCWPRARQGGARIQQAVSPLTLNQAIRERESGGDPVVSRASASFQPVNRLNVVHAAMVPLVA